MRKERKYRFYEKPPSFGGRFALLLAGISLALLLVALILSVAQGGEAGPAAGGAALIALLLSAYGFIAGLRSFQEKETDPRLGVIGSISSGVMLLILMAMFLSGIR